MKDRESKEERNIRVVREIWEQCYNYGDFDALLRNVSDNYVWRSNSLLPVPGQIVGKVAAVKYLREVVKILPGVFGDIETVVASGNTVTVISSTRAIRAVGFMGLPEINRSIEFKQCGFHVLTDAGKVQEQIFFYDRGYILGQLGVIPKVSLFGYPETERWPWPVYFDYLIPHDSGRGANEVGWQRMPSLGGLMKKVFQFPIQIISRSVRTALRS